MCSSDLYVLPLESLPFAGPWVDWIRGIMMAVALILTVVTGVDYLVRAAALVSRSRRAETSSSGTPPPTTPSTPPTPASPGGGV